MVAFRGGYQRGGPPGIPAHSLAIFNFPPEMAGKKIKKVTAYTARAVIFGNEFSEDSEVITSVKEFDENGNLIREIRHGRDGNVEEIITRLYDSDGNLTREEVFFSLSDSRET